MARLEARAAEAEALQAQAAAAADAAALAALAAEAKDADLAVLRAQATHLPLSCPGTNRTRCVPCPHTDRTRVALPPPPSFSPTRFRSVRAR